MCKRNLDWRWRIINTQFGEELALRGASGGDPNQWRPIPGAHQSFHRDPRLISKTPVSLHNQRGDARRATPSRIPIPEPTGRSIGSAEEGIGGAPGSQEGPEGSGGLTNRSANRVGLCAILVEWQPRCA